MQKHEKIEKKIILLSLWTGICFVIFEFFAAIYTGSQSVLMDAAYDASELLMLGLTLFLMPLFYRPISEKRPFGYAQIESFLVIIKGFMMLSVTIGLSAKSVEIALSGGNLVDGGLISVIQFIIALASLLVLVAMQRLNRSISSPIIDVEIYGWKIDVAYSLGMGAAFFASTFFEGTKLEILSPYFDQIIALLIIIFMLPEVIKMLFRAIKDLFLFSPETETMETVKDICGTILSEWKIEPTFYDVTRTGRRMWVVVYFQVQKEFLEVAALTKATTAINRALHEQFEHCVCELILDTDPLKNKSVDSLNSNE
ncbi:cation transporter [Lysinibacillus sp. 54212]|uniref:cation transporter n=1 Tax=Lysinibacillus sp. 54212 TaxID=3119829 RepID=UPI002FCC3A5C